VTRGENGHALREVLEDLEVRLEAYLAEWREQLGVQENVGAGIARDEQPPESTERKK
jgi:hypothetical protein